jgi:cytochrome c oxidase subunit IV
MSHENKQIPDHPITRKPQSIKKHLISFIIMIVFTSASFYLVATDVVPAYWVLPLIVLFAVIQVILQLFTFMHLDQKGSIYYTLFIMVGILIAVISAVGIFIM